MRGCKPRDGSSSTPSLKQKLAVRGRNLVPTASFKQEDARRRIYQLLLLNAWRRRRSQVATLADSLQTLKTQNGKLEIQVSALDELRQAECSKREEAVAQSLTIQMKANEVLKENEVLRQENVRLEKEMSVIISSLHEREVACHNLRNDWMTVRHDLKNTERQLEMEREKLKKVDKERLSLVDQLFLRERDLTIIKERIKELQETLTISDLSLKESLLSNSINEKDKKELMISLNNELRLHEELRNKLEESEMAKDRLEKVIVKLQKLTDYNKNTIKDLQEDNDTLKKKVFEVSEALEEEKQKPWWKNAGELAMVPLNVLQNAAYIMLPAMPTTKNSKTTSTTDMHTLIY